MISVIALAVFGFGVALAVAVVCGRAFRRKPRASYPLSPAAFPRPVLVPPPVVEDPADQEARVTDPARSLEIARRENDLAEAAPRRAPATVRFLVINDGATRHVIQRGQIAPVRALCGDVLWTSADEARRWSPGLHVGAPCAGCREVWETVGRPGRFG